MEIVSSKSFGTQTEPCDATHQNQTDLPNTSEPTCSNEPQVTWNPSNISALLKQLIISVVTDQLEGFCKAKCDCEHLQGITWDHITTSIVNEHNEKCIQTGVKLSSDMLVVSLQESSHNLDNNVTSVTMETAHDLHNINSRNDNTISSVTMEMPHELQNTNQTDLSNVDPFPIKKETIPQHQSSHHDDLDYFDPSSNTKASPKFKNSRHKPVQCATCLKWFRTKWHLTHHVAVHSKPTSHKCEVCQKVYKSEGHFKNHQKTHFPKEKTKTLPHNDDQIPNVSKEANTESGDCSLDQAGTSGSLESSDVNIDDAEGVETEHPVVPIKLEVDDDTPAPSTRVTLEENLVDTDIVKFKTGGDADNISAGVSSEVSADAEIAAGSNVIMAAKDFEDSDSSAIAEESADTGSPQDADCSAGVGNVTGASVPSGAEDFTADSLPVDDADSAITDGQQDPDPADNPHSEENPENTTTADAKDQSTTTTKDQSSGFKCPCCPKLFKARTKLIRHEATHVVDHNTYPCQHCDKVCASKWHLQQHQASHQEHPCDQCDKVFPRKHYYQRHVSTAHGAPHVCDVCGAVYKHYRTFQDHCKEHSGETYTCDVCHKVFSRPGTFRKHKQYHKSVADSQAFPCDSCDKFFARRSHLNQHVKMVHLKIRNHQCSYCEKSFLYASEKTSHEATHIGALSHVCQYCQKGFTHKESLRKHLLSHSSHKPHMCQFCGKSFSNKQHMRNHEETHSAMRTRQFPCSFCGKWFLTKTQCKVHEQRHQGVREDKCPHCTAAFVTKGDLLRHLKKHHAENCKIYSCSKCEMKFDKRSDLWEHQVSHV